MNYHEIEKELDSIREIVIIDDSKSEEKATYRILSPMQITVEYCSGLNKNDRYGFRLISPQSSWEMESEIDELFHDIGCRPQHRHDYFELVIVTSGEIIQKIEGKEYLYKAGSCCLVNRNIKHIERFVGPVKVYSFGLSTSLMQELIDYSRSSPIDSEQRIHRNPFLRFISENLNVGNGKEYLDIIPAHDTNQCIQRLQECAEQLVTAFDNSVCGASLIRRGLLMQLIDLLDTSFKETPIIINTTADGLLFLRITHLLQDSDGRLSRTQLSEKLHYNGSYLNNIVRHHTGMCLYDYSMSFCLKKAKELLLTTDMTVSEIATALKFSNRTHFYSLFKEKYGVTPKAYRSLSPGTNGDEAF